VAYLETNGPASASDERMLSELGWSRSRATQVLRELEQAGLVKPSSERNDSGRRKVYALLEPAGAA
jgi:DNA-binding MarR family transcriptional regulator